MKIKTITEYINEEKLLDQDIWNKRISKINKEKHYTDTKELSVGDYVNVIKDVGNNKKSRYEGFLVKKGRTNITIETTYMGKFILNVDFKLNEVIGFYKNI